MPYTNERLASPAGAGTESEPAGLLTTQELLRLLPISRRTLSTHIAEGRIPAIKLGRRILFDWQTVRQSLLRRQRGAA